MSSLTVLAIIAVVLFAVPFFAKRRLGMPALGLLAGAMLSQLWVGDITPIVASSGLVLVRPPLSSVVATVITLAPAMLLSLSGGTYASLPRRIVGALAFALLAVALLIEPIGSALVIDGPGRMVFDTLVRERTFIITVCLLLAIADVTFGKKASHRGRSSDKH